MFSLFIICLIIICILFTVLILRNFNKIKTVNTSCIICGKSTNSNTITTCSPKCNSIAKSKALTFVKRANANIKRQKHITGFELNYYQWKKTLTYFNNACAYCHKPIDDNSTHMDHFIPVANGGTFIFKNILPSCQECNQSKSKKSPFTFVNSIPLRYKQLIENFIKS
jgi:5-methylcytosine-specific restriction endonuclease McrA